VKPIVPLRAQRFSPIRALVDLIRDWIERFLAVQGVDRAMAIGAQAYTALFPLLIVYISISPLKSGRSMSQMLIDRLELDGSAADSVRQAFAPVGTVQSGVTVLSVALLLFSGLSFTRGLQRLYEGSFSLPTLGVKNTKWGVLWLLTVTAVGIWSVLWMPHTIASSADQFGVIGIGFALLTWMVAVAGVLVVAATGGALVSDRIGPRQTTVTAEEVQSPPADAARPGAGASRR
jgi:membrane protein